MQQTHDTQRHRLRSQLDVDTEFGPYLADTRIKLLKAIEKPGSTSPAATVGGQACPTFNTSAVILGLHT